MTDPTRQGASHFNRGIGAFTSYRPPIKAERRFADIKRIDVGLPPHFDYTEENCQPNPHWRPDSKRET
jgi:hypothetical protein